ncbi:Pr6Pr family membrane protein [Leifsonia sp. SIMBA_070]|uniref:Pr6Pr family membrane protein n=1 Tax=Leifsonia sp. SIMBA_070 TaxID=3085810 RepID=UPI00397BD701
MDSLRNVTRTIVAAAILIAVLVTALDVASRAPLNPFNFFGYFTVQSNLLLAGALIWSVADRRRRRGDVLAYVRAATTDYIVIVGIVYAALLAPLGQAGGVPVPWANVVLHIVTPLYGALDWLIFPDRPPLRWSALWTVLIYPAVWLAVVLIRGATDGWVPYPFLDPGNGYGTIAVVAAGITVAVILVGAAVYAASRVRLFSR